jgi:hypothetical protein
MFRTGRLDMWRPWLHEAASAAFAGLAGAIGASRQEQIFQQVLSLDQGAAIVRAWSLVHGFTMLLLDDRLFDIPRRLPEGTDAETLLEAMLKSTIVKPPGAVTSVAWPMPRAAWLRLPQLQAEMVDHIDGRQQHQSADYPPARVTGGVFFRPVHHGVSPLHDRLPSDWLSPL